VELLLTASSQEAADYVARRADSLPAITYSTVMVGADTTHWYRLVSGAFADSAAADSYLGTLRSTGRLATGAGAVSRTPFALLLDSASSDAIAQVRVSAFRGRGIPAYLLRDSSQVWRVYAGAFPTEGDARLLKQQLDSLNIQSALVMRAGSTP
jgi:cell division septation protein DedD